MKVGGVHGVGGVNMGGGVYMGGGGIHGGSLSGLTPERLHPTTGEGVFHLSVSIYN